jgi:hypothetical protein
MVERRKRRNQQRMTHGAVGDFKRVRKDGIDCQRIIARSAQLLKTGVTDIAFQPTLISEDHRKKILIADQG